MGKEDVSAAYRVQQRRSPGVLRAVPQELGLHGEMKAGKQRLLRRGQPWADLRSCSTHKCVSLYKHFRH